MAALAGWGCESCLGYNPPTTSRYNTCGLKDPVQQAAKAEREKEERRQERERSGPSKEEVYVEAAMKAIREDAAPSREFKVPRCRTCFGKVAPRRVEPPQAVPDLNALADILG